MILWAQGVVSALGDTWAGAVRLEVELEDQSVIPALAYPDVVGEPVLGDRVLLNTSA